MYRREKPKASPDKVPIQDASIPWNAVAVLCLEHNVSYFHYIAGRRCSAPFSAFDEQKSKSGRDLHTMREGVNVQSP
jgi:hypothetical protein